MRYAISTSPQRCTWDWLIDVWRKADEIELFESGWTFDHFYPLFGDSTEDCLEGWISLTALLQETKRIRGGVLVTGMLYRHPAVLANMASTLDITSNGRLELGIGAGWNEEECEAYGIELGSMEERFDRFEEGMEVVTQLLKQDRSTFKGNWYSLQDAMNNPKGPQNPLPICIGAEVYGEQYLLLPSTPTIGIMEPKLCHLKTLKCAITYFSKLVKKREETQMIFLYQQCYVMTATHKQPFSRLENMKKQE